MRVTLCASDAQAPSSRGAAAIQARAPPGDSAGDGLTNQQIGGRLHISPKTVEMHLTRTYSKLGISHRSALARVLTGAQARR